MKLEKEQGGADRVRRKERQGPWGRMGWGEEGRKKWKRGRGKGGETSLCGPRHEPLRSH